MFWTSIRYPVPGYGYDYKLRKAVSNRRGIGAPIVRVLADFVRRGYGAACTVRCGALSSAVVTRRPSSVALQFSGRGEAAAVRATVDERCSEEGAKR